MVTYTYESLHTPLNRDTDSLPAVDAEALIDQAIDLLNLAMDALANKRHFTATAISNLSGSAGAKTVTLTSAQAAAVTAVAKSVYYRDYREQVPAQLSALGTQVASTPEAWEVAKQMALGLVTRTGRDFVVAK